MSGSPIVVRCAALAIATCTLPSARADGQGAGAPADGAQALTAPWVRSLGPDAVLATRSTRLWGVRHGSEVAGVTFRVTRLYVREGGAWRLLFQQGSPLAADHVAGSGPGAPPRYARDRPVARPRRESRSVVQRALQ